MVPNTTMSIPTLISLVVVGEKKKKKKFTSVAAA
jgi:hypothetical protein